MPKYRDVKRAIYARIMEGEFTPGTVLPSERILVEQYQVSRITVRRAVADLIYEGVLYTTQGKGTFVRDHVRNLNLVCLTSCTEDIRKLGYKPTKKVISKNIEGASPSICSELELATGEKVFKLSRVFFADNNTVNYTTTYLAYKYFPEIEKYDFSFVSLYETLHNNYGLEILSAKRKIEAALPSAQVAEYLKMNVNTPILLFHCTTIGRFDGEVFPFETYTSWYRSDQYSFYIDQYRGGGVETEFN